MKSSFTAFLAGLCLLLGACAHAPSNPSDSSAEARPRSGIEAFGVIDAGVSHYRR